MTNHPKPSAEALAKADEICKKHGMLPGGYMRDSLAEDLDGFALEQRKRDMTLVCQGCQQGWPTVDVEGDLMHDLPLDLIAPHEHGSSSRTPCEAYRIREEVPVATMLGQPITMEELKRISSDGV